MAEGVDYSYSRPNLVCLKRSGKEFVVRYTSIGASDKNLTPDEATVIRAAGLDVVTVFEESPGHMLLGWDAGVQAARNSHDMAMVAGAPPYAAHYFALDVNPNQLTVLQERAVADHLSGRLRAGNALHDAVARYPDGRTAPVNLTASQWDACKAYLDGAASVLGRENVGLYGGFIAIEVLCPDRATWAWQTYAWSGGRISLKNHLYQYQNGLSLCGGLVDLDRAFKPDFGQWGRPAREEGMTLDSATKEYFDRQFELLRVGDRSGGDFDTHDYASLEGVGRRVQDVGKRVDALTALFQAGVSVEMKPEDVQALADAIKGVLAPATIDELARRLAG